MPKTIYELPFVHKGMLTNLCVMSSNNFGVECDEIRLNLQNTDQSTSTVKEETTKCTSCSLGGYFVMLWVLNVCFSGGNQVIIRYKLRNIQCFHDLLNINLLTLPILKVQKNEDSTCLPCFLDLEIWDGGGYMVKAVYWLFDLCVPCSHVTRNVYTDILKGANGRFQLKWQRTFTLHAWFKIWFSPWFS